MTDVVTVMRSPPAERLAALFHLAVPGPDGKEPAVREYLDMVQLAIAQRLYDRFIAIGAVDGDYRSPGPTIRLTKGERKVLDFIRANVDQAGGYRFPTFFAAGRLGLSVSYYHTQLSALINKGALARVSQGVYIVREGAP